MPIRGAASTAESRNTIGSDFIEARKIPQQTPQTIRCGCFNLLISFFGQLESHPIVGRAPPFSKRSSRGEVVFRPVD
jgi:hypothetical protein